MVLNPSSITSYLRNGVWVIIEIKNPNIDVLEGIWGILIENRIDLFLGKISFRLFVLFASKSIHKSHAYAITTSIYHETNQIHLISQDESKSNKHPITDK